MTVRQCKGCGVERDLARRHLYCNDCGTGRKGARNRYDRKIGKQERKPGKKCLNHESYVPACTNCKRLHKYDVTPERLAEMSTIDACETCGKSVALVLDHNHDTGEVRGMICSPCNMALGLIEDSVATLEAMIIYLKDRNTYGA